ncbi:MAG: putative Fimbrial assembly family protein [Candidatus Saccharibacteria bacterium]|nr:putative Fimbrial assembly family protein [Candidatus Saccharibacteria bacterium]
MSKVQFNLLPDTKLQYNKDQQTKHRVTAIAYSVSAISLAIFLLLLFTVDVVQKKQLSDAAKEVDTASKQLRAVPQIDEIITVQNQLKTLSGLHQNKHVTSRIFTYLPQLTPANVTINKLDLDLKQNTMAIVGTANSQHSVNTFVDTLKFATYKVNSTDSAVSAFPSVVESGFTINPANIGYTISIQFDPKLFANNLVDSNGKSKAPQLTVRSTSAGSLDPSSTLFNSSQSGGGQ